MTDEDEPSPEDLEALDAELADEETAPPRADTRPGPDAEWVTGADTVDRTGMFVYLHIVRGSDDPERQKRATERADAGGGSQVWRKMFRKASVEQWTDAIRKHVADGEPRTFNRIMVELCDMTADVAFDKAPDRALWALVAAGEVEHTLETPIYFRRRAPEPEVGFGGTGPGAAVAAEVAAIVAAEETPTPDCPRCEPGLQCIDHRGNHEGDDDARP